MMPHDIAAFYVLGGITALLAMISLAGSTAAWIAVGKMRKEMAQKDARIVELEKQVKRLRQRLKELGHDPEEIDE